MTSNFGTLRLSTPTGPLLAAKLALFETAINTPGSSGANLITCRAAELRIRHWAAVKTLLPTENPAEGGLSPFAPRKSVFTLRESRRTMPVAQRARVGG